MVLSMVRRACGLGGRRAARPDRRRQGPPRLRGQGRPVAAAQRCGAPLRPEERVRSLRGACLDRVRVVRWRVSGGEAASGLGWVAARCGVW